ncbi:hypothetical protein A4G20_04050 [Pasteurellaceae bacterium RH1A]|nr:hypothetical protein A4G20_04050 [Pasteurellaceae bacterium RH1A]
MAEILIKYVTSFFVIFLLVNEVSFVTIILGALVLVVLYVPILNLIKKVKITFSSMVVLIIFSELIFFFTSYFFTKNIEGIETITQAIALYTIPILINILILYTLSNHKINNRVLITLIYSTIITIGYYFYYLIPNDIVRITQIGTYIFSDLYQLIISFLFFLFLLALVLAGFLPLTIILSYMNLTSSLVYPKEVKYKIRWKKKIGVIPVLCSVSFGINVLLLEHEIDKMRTDYYIANMLVYLFYMDKLPVRCDQNVLYYPEEDKFMFVDINNISLAYKKGDSYEFGIGQCQVDFKP